MSCPKPQGFLIARMSYQGQNRLRDCIDMLETLGRQRPFPQDMLTPPKVLRGALNETMSCVTRHLCAGMGFCAGMGCRRAASFVNKAKHGRVPRASASILHSTPKMLACLVCDESR